MEFQLIDQFWKIYQKKDASVLAVYEISVCSQFCKLLFFLSININVKMINL